MSEYAACIECGASLPRIFYFIEDEQLCYDCARLRADDPGLFELVRLARECQKATPLLENSNLGDINDNR